MPNLICQHRCKKQPKTQAPTWETKTKNPGAVNIALPDQQLERALLSDGPATPNLLWPLSWLTQRNTTPPSKSPLPTKPPLKKQSFERILLFKNAFYCIKEIIEYFGRFTACNIKAKRFNTCALPIYVHNALLRNTNPLVDQQICTKNTGGSANPKNTCGSGQPLAARRYLAENRSRS